MTLSQFSSSQSRVSQTELPSLHILLLHHQQGKPLSRDSAYSFLQECLRKKDILSCRTLHSYILFHELHSISSLGDHLIRFFGFHGHLLEANLAFCKTSQKSAYTWEALISTYVNLGENENALAFYNGMHMRPSKFVCLAVLRACSNREDIQKGRLIHAEVIKFQLESDLVVESSLLNMYAQCGELEDARKVFDEWAGNDVVMWNGMIAAYTMHGHGLTTLKLYEKMEQKQIEPDKVTCLCLLKSCAKVGSVMEGWYIHNEIIRRGFNSDVTIGNTLVDMYAKCRELEESERVFSLLSQNVVTWNARLSGYVNHGHDNSALELFKRMQQQGLKPDKITFLSIIKACSNLGAIGKGQMIHDDARRAGLGGDVAINNALIHMYANGGNIELARNVFDSSTSRDMVSWGAMISGYVQHGHPTLAFKLVCDMLFEGIKPEKVVLLYLLKACGNKEALEDGHLVHYQIIDQAIETDVAVGSTLIDMYAKCKSLEEACNVFDTLPTRDVVSWSVMIAGYVQQGHEAFAFDLFGRMQQEDVKPDRVTYLCLLKASGNVKAIGQGKQIHRAMVENGPELDVVVGTTLIDMYVKCGEMEEARQVFDKMASRNEVSWSVMIAGYIQHGQSLPALDLFQEMMKEGITPDNVLMLGILKASGSVGAIGPGMMAHDQIVRSKVDLELMIGNTLIDMYAKCGRVEEAHRVFDLLPLRDAVSRNAIIAADAQNENFVKVMQTFEDMKQEDFKPDESTFTSILAACCQSGRVEDGQQQFKSMTEEYEIVPTVEHLNCVIDLLGRAARFDAAKHFIETVSISPDVTTWLSLLTACRSYKNVEFGRVCFDEVVQLDPNAAAAYVLMSNIYADAHRWEYVNKLQLLRQCTSAWKKPEVAWLEFQNRVHEFMVSDKHHPEGHAMHMKVGRLKFGVREAGYIPMSSSIHEFGISEDEKIARFWHSQDPGSNVLLLNTDNLSSDLTIISKIRKYQNLSFDTYKDVRNEYYLNRLINKQNSQTSNSHFFTPQALLSIKVF